MASVLSVPVKTQYAKTHDNNVYTNAQSLREIFYRLSANLTYKKKRICNYFGILKIEKSLSAWHSIITSFKDETVEHVGKSVGVYLLGKNEQS